FDGPSADAYRRLRTRLMAQHATQPFRTIVVASAIRGEGKTLTATNLAITFSQLENFKVLLVDADLRTRGCSHLLHVDYGPGLCGILAPNATYSDAIATTDCPQLLFLNAGSSEIPCSELLAAGSWPDFIAWASSHFDMVIFDAPPILPVPD